METVQVKKKLFHVLAFGKKINFKKSWNVSTVAHPGDSGNL